MKKKGVLINQDDETSVISNLSLIDFNDYLEKQIITSGMIPKLSNGFNALNNGVSKVLITNPENLSSGKGTNLVLKN